MGTDYMYVESIWAMVWNYLFNNKSYSYAHHNQLLDAWLGHQLSLGNDLC